MSKCAWPLLATCVFIFNCAPARAQFIPDEVPINDESRGIVPRFDRTTSEIIRDAMAGPKPFEFTTRETARPAATGVVSANALRHKVPKNAQKAYDQGLKALEKGDQDRALEQLRKAVAIDNLYALAHSNLGVALVRQEKFVEAEESFRRALALDPYMTTTNANLAWVLAKLGRLGEAVKTAERVLAIDPANESANKLLSALNRQPRP